MWWPPAARGRGDDVKPDIAEHMGLHSNVKQREDMRPRSRGAMRPRFASTSPSFENRGRRESRMPIAPAVVRTKRTSGPQAQPDHSGFPCANGLRLTSGSPR